ncbi:MAG TPA: hypothetical protein VMW38_06880 [Terriglobia bacterium]|nr:hypothetical protein [Terriglobia bacterium]
MKPIVDPVRLVSGNTPHRGGSFYLSGLLIILFLLSGFSDCQNLTGEALRRRERIRRTKVVESIAG